MSYHSDLDIALKEAGRDVKSERWENFGGIPKPIVKPAKQNTRPYYARVYKNRWGMPDIPSCVEYEYELEPYLEKLRTNPDYSNITVEYL